MKSRPLTGFYAFGSAWYIFYIFSMVPYLYDIVVSGHSASAELRYCGIQLISLWATAVQFSYYFTQLYLAVKNIKGYDNILSGFFYYVVLTTTIQVSLFFWPVYLLDKRLVDRYDYIMDKPFINHTTHTVTVVLSVIEAFLRKKPSKLKYSTMFWHAVGILFSYVQIVTLIHKYSGQWPYPFMDYLEAPFGFDFFILGNSVSAFVAVWSLLTAKECLENLVAVLPRYIKTSLK